MEQSHFAEEIPMKIEIFPQTEQVTIQAAAYLEQVIRKRMWLGFEAMVEYGEGWCLNRTKISVQVTGIFFLL